MDATAKAWTATTTWRDSRRRTVSSPTRIFRREVAQWDAVTDEHRRAAVPHPHHRGCVLAPDVKAAYRVAAVGLDREHGGSGHASQHGTAIRWDHLTARIDAIAKIWTAATTSRDSRRRMLSTPDKDPLSGEATQRAASASPQLRLPRAQGGPAEERGAAAGRAGVHGSASGCRCHAQLPALPRPPPIRRQPLATNVEPFTEAARPDGRQRCITGSSRTTTTSGVQRNDATLKPFGVLGDWC
jgi:hypothetical protein